MEKVRDATRREPLPPPFRDVDLPSLKGGQHYLKGEALSLDGVIWGSDYAAVRIDPEGGEWAIRKGFSGGITERAITAIYTAPEWIRFGLLATFSRLTEEHQEILASTLLSVEEERWMDEVAFCLAAMTPKDLTYNYFDPSILLKNAEYIYLMEEYLDYAEVVDVDDDPSNPYSTLRLRYHQEGEEKYYTLPPEYYYWFVVHPRLDFDPDERVIYINPDTGRYSQDKGYFWREYYPFSAEDSDLDYTVHYIMKNPEEIDEESLDSLSSHGYFTDLDIDPLKIFVDPEGNPLAIEIDKGAGTILSTTIPLEEVCFEEGECDLLINFLTYGNTNDTLNDDSLIAVIKDRDVFGHSVPTYTLLDYGYTEITELPLESFLSTDTSLFEKVIIPCCQSGEFYSSLEENREFFEDYVSAGGVLQIDLQDSPSGDIDISSFTYPGSFTVAREEEGEVLRGGQPLFLDVMEGCESLWDSIRYDGLTGERALSEGSFALDRLGYFTSQNLFDNVSEYMENHINVERHSQPVRILKNHYGNCGEIQDVLGAGGRSGLIPVALVDSMEDHVWNEFYLEGAWHPFQVDWSDGDTRIDNNGVASDTMVGGGKNVSMMSLIKGNGSLLNPVERYTDTITVRIEVIDGEGAAVDGARVVFWSEYYYDPSTLDTIFWAFTDEDGTVEVKLGDNRNYYINVRGVIDGDYYYYPGGSEEEIEVKQIVSDEEAVAGEEFDHTVSFEGAKRGRSFTLLSEEEDWHSRGALTVEFTFPDEGEGEEGMTLFNPPAFLLGYNFVEDYSSDRADVDDPYFTEGLATITPLTFYLLTEENFALFEEEEEFTALQSGVIGEGDRHGEISLPFPEFEGDYLYLVFENTERYNITSNISVNLTVTMEGCGSCSIHKKGRLPAIPLLLLLPGLCILLRTGAKGSS